MKSTYDMTTLGGLILALAVTMGPGTALAENGSDRLEQYRMHNQQQLQMREDSSESFTRMVEEQPTAAGLRYQEYQDDDMRSTGQPTRKYQLLIQQQKVEFGK